MEEPEFEDVLDDWFIESLKTYKDLHVYQLEHSTRVIEWTSEKSVCVSGCTSSKNEILELCLPLKLFADDKKGLCAERDFKVLHGGFTDTAVGCLRHIPGTRFVVTSDGRSSDLQVWDLGDDDSDVIRKTGSIKGRGSRAETCSRIAARPSAEPQVLHGAHIRDVQLTHLISNQVLYKLEADSADRLSSLQFVDDSVFLASCFNGSVYVVDSRTPAAPKPSPPPASPGNEAGLWWADASIGSHLSCCRVARLSSCGRAVISDVRNLSGVVHQAQLEIQTRCCKTEDVKVAWAPALKDHLSVSGFHGDVEIYDTSLWRTELQAAQPLFQHHGHVVSSQQNDSSLPVFVTSHTWHPKRARTLLSAASDGSLHVWDWVEPDTE